MGNRDRCGATLMSGAERALKGGSDFPRRGLARFIAAEGISVSGDWVLNTAAAIAVFRETGSTVAVSILLGLAAVPTVLLAPLAGALADRHDRRLLMVVSDLLSAVTLLGGAAAVHAGAEIPAVYAAVLLLAMLATFHRPAGEALLPVLSGERQLGRANSMLRLASRLAMIVGPAAASAMMSAGGTLLVFSVDAASFCVSAALVARIPGPTRPQLSEQGASAFTAAIQGLRFAKSNARVRIVILAIGVTMLVAPIVNAGTLALVSDELHLPDNRYGVLLAVEGAGALALALVFTWLGPKLKLLPVGIAGLLVTGGATVLLGGSPNLATGMVAMALMGMGVVGMQVAFASYLQRETVDDYRGRVMSLVSMVAAFAGLAGFAAAGPFVYLLGVRQAFILAGLVICLSAAPVVPLALSRGEPEIEAAVLGDAEAKG